MKMKIFSFVERLHVLEKALKLTYGLSEQFQKVGISITTAAILIKSTKHQLEMLRSDAEWQNTFSEARAFGTEAGLSLDTPPPPRPARIRNVSRALAGCIVGSSGGQRPTTDMPDYHEKRLYIEVLDCFNSKFNRCFTDSDVAQTFNCSSPNLFECKLDWKVCQTIWQAQ